MSLKYQINEVSLIYRQRYKIKRRPVINDPLDAYIILKEQWDESKISLLEEVKLLLLNRAHAVLGVSDIASGGVSSSIADPKIIYATALKANASSIILAHNHPSGSLKPSQSDITLTEKLRQAGSFLDISFLDHMILTQGGYYSFADSGYVF